MRIQFQILAFIVCLNLAVGLSIALGLPGTEYVQATNPSNASEYEGHFNATEIAEGWGATPYSGIPVIGDIFSGFQFLWRNLQYLIDGFPLLLTWISDTYIIDAAGQTAFAIIANALRAIYAVLITILVIEFITGRILTD